jgi:hypothetical protein
MTCAKILTPLDDFVRVNLGPDRLENLNAQSRGGANNSKGNKHEGFFATYRLAKSHVDNPKDDIEISTQCKAFVDDLVVSNLSTNSKRSYQLKDSQRVYWHNAKGIFPYFRDQYEIDKKFYGVDCSKTILVLAHKDVYDRRNKDIPQEIKPHTECMLFKNSDSANKILLENDDFRDVVSKFCAFPEESDKLEFVLQNLYGAWVTHNTQIKKVSELINLAKNAANPDFFIDTKNTYTLSPEFQGTLDKIGGLSYIIANGYLNYKVKSFSGSVRAKIGSPEFDNLCETIVKVSPKDAQTLFSFLMKVGA